MQALVAFCREADKALADLQEQDWTGVFTCAVQFDSGQPKHASREAVTRTVLRRQPEDGFVSIYEALNKVITPALKQNGKFFGKMEISLQVFAGEVIDISPTVRQTFSLTAK